MLGLPLGDWQFWLVTALTAMALAVLLPRRRSGNRAPRCPSCPDRSSTARPPVVPLSVEGRRLRSQ